MVKKAVNYEKWKRGISDMITYDEMQKRKMLIEVFALAINGTMLYFEGNIPPNMYNDIDMLSKQVVVDPLDNDYTDFCNQFIMLVKEKYNIQLTQMKIAYVFRPLV